MQGPRSGHRPDRTFFLRHPLLLCAALSVALHALLLTVRTGSDGNADRTTLAPAETGRIRVRLMTASGEHSIARTMAPVPTAQARQAISGTAPVTPGPRPTRHPTQEASTAENSTALAQTERDKDSGPMRPVEQADATPDHNDYVPRPLLTVPPVAQAPVLIGEPTGATQTGRYVGILSLFIDEEGRVQYVAADEPALPPLYEQAARDAFIAARFSPGQVDGRAVKSRVRVEVVFDSTPLSP